MTDESDFKKLVRARMARTGETYTIARAALDHDRDQRLETAWHEQEAIARRFFKEGRLNQTPVRRGKIIHVLLELLRDFEPERRYSEAEVNEILLTHADDYAYWRRELVDYGYLSRDAGVYWVRQELPNRPAWLQAEFPAWEREWLLDFWGRS